MSQSDSPPEPGDKVEPIEYDAMLETLDTAITEVEEKIDSGRIRDVEKEKTWIQYYRALAYLIRTKRQVLEDKTLDELADEIEGLKETDTENDTDG